MLVELNESEYNSLKKALNENNYYNYTPKQVTAIKRAITKLLKKGFRFEFAGQFKTTKITLDNIDTITNSNIDDIAIYDDFLHHSINITSMGKFRGKYIELYNKSKSLNNSFNCFVALDMYPPEEAVKAADSWIEYKKFTKVLEAQQVAYEELTAAKQMHDLG